MRSTWRMSAGGLAVAASAVLLSACSSSPAAPRGTTTTRPPSHSTTTGTTTRSPTTSTTPTTASIATCRASALRVADTGQGGAAGTQEVTFSLTNTSSSPCATYGYPGLLLVSTSGAALPTTVDRGGPLDFEDISPTHVTLAAGRTAYFNVGFNDVQSSTGTCSSTGTVDVTPPTATAHVVTSVAPDIDACDGGTLHVSAVFASTDAAATRTTAPPAA